MTRHRVLLSSAGLAATAALALPAAAPAKIAELGQLADGVKGACPENCQAVSRTTGYQAKVGPERALYQAPADGRIVAWTIALGKPGPKQTAFFTERLGGASQAAIVVLEPDKKLVRRVVAKAPIQNLTDYFGQTVQFPLAQTLPIKKGQYVGLTVPTWAPALQIGLGGDTSWRASRAKDTCADTSTQSALVGSRRAVAFACLFKTARLTYSATLVTSPTVTKDASATTTTTTPAAATTTTTTPAGAKP
ncbi:MAG: hypothetical protein QOH83_599 [Solirubrobacteraceae bacterium]|jgi:hypothetical protein|nr:hypothetical protein [Solirubrobacteraceae bacterium]